MCRDVRAYGPDSIFRCFHVRLPRGISAGRIPLRVRINAERNNFHCRLNGGQMIRKTEREPDAVNLLDGFEERRFLKRPEFRRRSS
jgi:hypothetical protein